MEGGNLTEFAQNVGRCSDFYVTFYWKTAATGAHFYISIVAIFINIPLSLLGTLINVLVIYANVKENYLRTSSATLFVVLACSNLLIATLVQPLSIARTMKEVQGTHDCLLSTFARLTLLFSCGVSLLTVAIISVERFITLAYPLRYQSIITPTRLNIVVASTWLTIFTLVISHLGLIPYNILTSLGAIIILLTILTITIVWIWIYRLLRRHKKRIKTIQTPSSTTGNSPNSKQEFRNTRTSYLLVVALLLCYLPSFVFLAYCSTEPNNFVALFLVSPCVETIMFFNSVLNPVLFLWRKREFRNTARELLFKMSCIGRSV